MQCVIQVLPIVAVRRYLDVLRAHDPKANAGEAAAVLLLSEQKGHIFVGGMHRANISMGCAFFLLMKGFVCFKLI